MSKPKRKRKLNPRQQKFVKEYTNPKSKSFGNGTRSAEAAGYTAQRLDEAGSQILRNTAVQHEIQGAMERIGLTEEMALTQLKEGLAAVQVRVFCQDGQLTYSKEITDNQERRLSAVEVLKLRGRYPTNRTVERLELLRIQNTLIVVPGGLPEPEEKEKQVRQLTD